MALFRLPVAQYPDVVPPTVQVTTRYPGASAKTVIDTVALPIEQQVNGVEDMLYMQSYSGRRRHLHADGHLQDRHRSQLRAGAGAEPRVERAVVAAAVGAGAGRHRAEEVDRDPAVRDADVARSRPTTAFFSAITPRSTCRTNCRALPGVGNVNVFGAGQYSMRVWLDPNKLQARGLTPQDVIKAMQQQSQQVTAGQIGMPPAPAGQAFQYTLNVNGRLDDAGAIRTT